MYTRADLHTALVDIYKKLEMPHEKRVFFQAPANITRAYPYIVYSLVREKVQFADNRHHVRLKRYSIMLVTDDIETPIIGEIEKIRTASFERQYVHENLYHIIYNIYLI